MNNFFKKTTSVALISMLCGSSFMIHSFAMDSNVNSNNGGNINYTYKKNTNSTPNKESVNKDIYLNLVKNTNSSIVKWNSDDFNFNGDTLTGLSDKGSAKLKLNPIVELPTVDTKGNPITKVGDSAFEQAGLDGVIIPEGYVEIGGGAFDMNDHITSVNFPSTLKVIGASAFSDCGLKGTLTIPKTITSVGEQSFYGNYIDNLVINAPLTSISDRAFKGNLIKNVTLPDTVTSIGQESFAYNHIKKMILPKGVKSISADAFDGNNGYNELEKKVWLVEDGAATSTSKKANYIINPKITSVKELDDDKLNNTDFVYNGSEIKSLNEAGYNKLIQSGELIIPDKSPDGTIITSIGEDAFANRPDSINKSLRVKIKKLVMPDTIKTIGQSAFQGLGIEEVTIPKSCEVIGNMAFMEDPISKLTLNDGLKSIGNTAFYDTAISDLVIPKSVTNIEEGAFMTSKIKSITFLGNGVTDIKNNVFGDNRLQSITLPEGVKTIDDGAFSDNILKVVNLPSTVEKVSKIAFNNNPGDSNYDNKVVVNTFEHKNTANISSGVNYTVDPLVQANESELDALKLAINNMNKVDASKQSSDYQDLFKELNKVGNDVLARKSKNDVIFYTNDINERVRRAPLDALINTTSGYSDEDSSKYKNDPNFYGFGKALDNANNVLQYVDVDDLALKSTMDRLKDAIDVLTGSNISGKDLKNCKVVEGTFTVPQRDNLESFVLKVDIYYKDGKIVAVYPEKTVADTIDPTTGEEGDDNREILNRALRVIPEYENLSIDKVKSAKTMNDLGIKPISKVEDIDGYLHQSILDALSKIKNEKTSTTTVDNKDVKKDDKAKLGTESKESKKNGSTTLGHRSHHSSYVPSQSVDSSISNDTHNNETSKQDVPKQDVPKQDVSKQDVSKQDIKAISNEIITNKKATRLAGKNRYETAVDISRKVFKKADTVILSNGNNYSDVITAMPLANSMKAPVLFTSKDSTDSNTLNEIHRLGAKKIIVVGGDKSISNYEESNLAKLGINIERINGKDRFDTANNIAKLLKSNKKIKSVVLVNANSYSDALSVTPLALKENAVIIPVKKDSINKNFINFLSNKKIIVVGGGNQIDQNLYNYISKFDKNIVRLYGKDRYETSLKVADYGYKDSKTVVFASGQNFADGLVSSEIANIDNAPVVLVSKNSNKELKKLVGDKVEKEIFIGGNKSITNKFINSL